MKSEGKRASYKQRHDIKSGSNINIISANSVGPIKCPSFNRLYPSTFGSTINTAVFNVGDVMLMLYCRGPLAFLLEQLCEPGTTRVQIISSQSHRLLHVVQEQTR